MHRNERIAQAISTLQAIEAAVAVRFGGTCRAEIRDMHKAEFDRTVDNVVRLYASSEQADATHALRLE